MLYGQILGQKESRHTGSGAYTTLADGPPPFKPTADPAAAPAPVSLTDPPQPPALTRTRARRCPPTQILRQPTAYEAVPATAAWSLQGAAGGGSQPPADSGQDSESDGSYA
jgi:hypothetical protein